MIQVNALSKSYRSGRGVVHAVSDVSFTLAVGKTLTVVGKSGSGKTTLLSCIGGLEHPESGTIDLFGTSLADLSARQVARFRRENIGFVFQAGNLLSYLTVRENIALPLQMNGIKGKEAGNRIQTLLEQIELPDAGPALPGELSGGEAQRVAVARAIAHQPRLLLADEPTANLDSETSLKLIPLMLQLGKQQDCTIILSTHDRDLLPFSDRTLTLIDGKKK